MALEEKYPGGYSPGCYDDEDEDDDEDDIEDDDEDD